MNGTERAKGRFYRWTGVQILSWDREEGNFHMAEGNADTQTGDHIAIDREAYQTPKAKIKGEAGALLKSLGTPPSCLLGFSTQGLFLNIY